jgi:hypothetical protein
VQDIAISWQIDERYFSVRLPTADRLELFKFKSLQEVKHFITSKVIANVILSYFSCL